MGVEWGGYRSDRQRQFERRRLGVLTVVALIVLAVLAVRDGVIHNEPPPTNTPDILEDTRP